MAEHVISAIVSETASVIASAIRNKIDELNGVLLKISWLEWKVLKISSAIEESEKYDINNGPLGEWRHKYIDMVKEANDVLQYFKNRSTASDPQRSLAASWPRYEVMSFVARIGFGVPWSDVWLENLINRQIRKMMSFLKRFVEIEKLNRTLEKLEMMSNDVGDFLEMLRHQKRKRDRRRRYRPYKDFFELIFVYLELLQDALGYCRAQVCRMQFLLPEMGTVVDADRVSGLKAGAVRISAVPEVWLDVVSFSHNSLLLV